MQPIINGRTVERAYDDYCKETFLVNRRYQRKLVWSLKEKTAFVDSLMNGYPVPLFLFLKISYRDQTCLEVIDGMQRLNALFCFIENKFSLDTGEYFDLCATAKTKGLLDTGELIQKEPILARDKSIQIASYELPFSVYEVDDTAVIDEVFRRINAYGKHLSRQEIRQAGAIKDFAQFVRKLAEKVRGDVSHSDYIFLSKMKEISISQGDETYGINADNIFWIKYGILSKEDVRQSDDEEIIADLLAAMLISPIPPSGAQTLDDYYSFHPDETESRGIRVEEALSAVGSELWIVNSKSDRFYKVRDLLNSAGDKYPSVPCKRMLLNQ